MSSSKGRAFERQGFCVISTRVVPRSAPQRPGHQHYDHQQYASHVQQIAGPMPVGSGGVQSHATIIPPLLLCDLLRVNHCGETLRSWPRWRGSGVVVGSIVGGSVRSLSHILVVLLGVGLVAGSTLGLGACSSSGVPEVPASPDGEVDPILVAGRHVYVARCANCHGDRGQGGRGSVLRGESVVEVYPVVADQVRVVADGKSSMPGFADTLTSEEIEAVVRFTREVL